MMWDVEQLRDVIISAFELLCEDEKRALLIDLSDDCQSFHDVYQQSLRDLGWREPA